jgi:hypothetical protein
MKKLFGRAVGTTTAAASKKDGAGPLTNKTVQVGPHTVLVEHVLGLGGYGEIYRAVDISSGQRFALKVGGMLLHTVSCLQQLSGGLCVVAGRDVLACPAVIPAGSVCLRGCRVSRCLHAVWLPAACAYICMRPFCMVLAAVSSL